ncbi:hypothetical protein PCK1_001249 [Pneumocystis canis]|nr:hypothetical protein PCK1_001249 [Pneumocystis canis]
MTTQFSPIPSYSVSSHSSESSSFQIFTLLQSRFKNFEESIDIMMSPFKSYIPALGRLLIVVTFIEDSVRIMTQMKGQLYYLHVYRHFYRGLSHAFLILNVLVMSIASLMVVIRKKSEIAVGLLFGVVIAQSIGYGLIFDKSLFFR